MSHLETTRTKAIDSERKRQRAHDRETFCNVLEQHLDALYNFVRREIAYRIAIGDVVPDETALDDVVVAVALRAQYEFADQPQATSFRAWLIGLALEQVDAEVTHSERKRDHIRHADHPVPDTQPADRLAAIGDEILEGFVSDRDVARKDGDPGSLIIRVLKTLPRAHRLAFVLHVVDGLPLHDIMRVINRSEFETIRNLEQTRNVMHDCLGAAFQSHAGSRGATRDAYNLQVSPAMRQTLSRAITAANRHNPDHRHLFGAGGEPNAGHPRKTGLQGRRRRRFGEARSMASRG
jgi:DNA-directed RNA polymerase specialized sigma24 family protein